MQYYFCPRCKFRMIGAKRHICPTCGYKLPRVEQAVDTATTDTGERRARRTAITAGFWSKLFKWEIAADNDSMESTQEKPALS